MAASIQLVIPGLFDLPMAELEPGWLDQELPYLNRLLRFSSTSSTENFGIDQILRSALGLEKSAAGEFHGLPVAQSLSDDTSHARHLLLAQAIHLKADLHSAVIVPIPDNNRNRHDISILIKDLKDLFKVDFDLVETPENAFLMRLFEMEAPTHYAHLLSALGQTASPFMQQSPQNLDWYRLNNEIQMFLHQHDINQHRTREGLLSINSLWFWGGGARPLTCHSQIAWLCDDRLLNRFVEGLGISPRSFSEMGTNFTGSDIIAVELRLLEYLKLGSSGNLQQLLHSIDDDVVRPLLEKVEQAGYHLHLRAGFDTDFEIRPIDRFKIWRRSRQLGHWIESPLQGQ